MSRDALTALIDHAEAALLARQSDAPDRDNAGFMFTGTPLQSIPENLILARELQATDKVLWMTIKTYITTAGMPNCLPKRSELLEILDCSAPTAALARKRLRVTGWITLCRQVRNELGQFVTDLYLVHDTPLALQDIVSIDPTFISLLDKGAESSNKAYQALCKHRLDELAAISIAEGAQPRSQLATAEENIARRVCAPESVSAGDNLNDTSQVKILYTDELTQVKNLYMDKSRTYEKVDQKLAKNTPEERNFTQGKNLYMVRSSIKTSSSSNNITNARARENNFFNPDNTPPSNLAEQARQQTLTIKRDMIPWNAAPKAIADNPRMRDLVEFLMLTPSRQRFHNSDLARFTGVLADRPKAAVDAVLDQTLGHMLSAALGLRKPITNPASYLRALADSSLKTTFVCDEWGERVAELHGKPRVVYPGDDEISYAQRLAQCAAGDEMFSEAATACG